MNCTYPGRTCSRQTLILVPGLDGTGVFFRPLVEALPAWIEPRIFAFNQERPRTYTALYGALEAFVAETPRCHVLAWSYGGPLGVMLAHRRAQVSSLILASSFVRNPRPDLHILLTNATWPVIGLVRTVRRVPIWFGRRRADPYRQAKAKVWATVSSGELAARLRTLPKVDVRRELACTTQPLLCLSAAADRVVPGSCTAEIRAARPDAVVVEIPGPHFALYFNAPAVAQTVAAFIADAVQWHDREYYTALRS